MDQPTAYRTRDFRQLFDTYKVPVHNYIYSITKDTIAAEDLTQELFLTIWEKPGLISQVDNLEQYIFRMAHNASMRWFVKLGQDKRLFKRVKDRMHNHHPNNVLENINYQEALGTLQEAIEGLSPQRRKVYELSRNQGYKIHEIALELGISPDTAKNHLVAALANIRKHFTARDQDTVLLMLIVWGIHSC